MSPYQTNANRFTYRMVVVTRHQRQQALTRWQLQHADQHDEKPASTSRDREDAIAPLTTPIDWQRMQAS